MKILITAFEPFGGEPVNPAQEAVALVPDEIAGAQIIKCTVPVVFSKAIETVCAAIDREEPDAVLCIGQAGGRFHLTLERVAINIDDARIPDNAGHQPRQEKILETGPETYETPVPVEALCRQMQQEGFEIEPSQDAGAYVCNDTFYLTGLRSPAPVFFIHVPAQPDQAEDYARTVARVIELAVEAIPE